MTEKKPLHHYLDASIILVHAELSSRKKLLQEMARLLAQPLQEKWQDKPEENVESDVYHALLEREKIGNTGIGNGIALPHSRLADIEEAVIAIVTLVVPIDYDSPDRQAVDVAFGLLVPQDASQEHLAILADIARMMSNKDNKNILSLAKTPEEVMSLIERWTDEATPAAANSA